jgi:hypothetical protein
MSRYPSRTRHPPTRLVIDPEYPDGSERPRYEEEAVGLGLESLGIECHISQELQEWLEGNTSDSDYEPTAEESSSDDDDASTAVDLQQELEELTKPTIDEEAEALAAAHADNPWMSYQSDATTDEGETDPSGDEDEEDTSSEEDSMDSDSEEDVGSALMSFTKE